MLYPNVFKRAVYIRQAKLPRIKMSGPDGGQVDVKLVVHSYAESRLGLGLVVHGDGECRL